MEISMTGRSHSSLFQTPTYPLTHKGNLQQQCRKPLWTIYEGVSMQSLIPQPDRLLFFANSGCKKVHFPPHFHFPCLLCQDSASTAGREAGQPEHSAFACAPTAPANTPAPFTQFQAANPLIRLQNPHGELQNSSH